MGLAVAFTFETFFMISYLQKAKKRKWCSKLDDDILFQAIWIIKIGLIWYYVFSIFIRIYILITEINLVKAFSNHIRILVSDEGNKEYLLLIVIPRKRYLSLSMCEYNECLFDILNFSNVNIFEKIFLFNHIKCLIFR